jgi:hypothetical protein
MWFMFGMAVTRHIQLLMLSSSHVRVALRMHALTSISCTTRLDAGCITQRLVLLLSALRSAGLHIMIKQQREWRESVPFLVESHCAEHLGVVNSKSVSVTVWGGGLILDVSTASAGLCLYCVLPATLFLSVHRQDNDTKAMSVTVMSVKLSLCEVHCPAAASQDTYVLVAATDIALLVFPCVILVLLADFLYNFAVDC